jgi:hypothetical protein
MDKKAIIIRRLVGASVCLLMISLVFHGVYASKISNQLKSERIFEDSTNLLDKESVSIEKYWAILVCGSNDFNLGFETDIRDMYLLLKNVLGYNDNNLWYVAPSNWNQATHYYAISQNNIQKAIQDIAGLIAYEDCLFFYYTAHGSAQSLDGDGDKTPGEPEDVSAAELDSWLDGVNVKQMVIVLQGCNTGSFINTLNQSKRIIITATDSQTSAWEDMNGYGDPNWDPNGPNDDGASNPQNDNWDGSEFSSGFRMAYRDIDSDGYKEADENVYINTPGKTPDLTSPSGNKDGKVSVQESFNFAIFEDYASPYWETYIQQQGWLLEYPQLSYKDINPSTTYIYMTNQPPVALFTWTPYNPNPGITVTFDASSSYDPDGSIVLYEWDWNNDGIYDESHTTHTTTHLWPNTGNYPITLRVTDIDGTTDTVTLTIAVGGGNQPPNTPTINGPANGKLGVSIEYTFNAIDPNGDQVKYLIDWGDGKTDTTALNPSGVDVIVSHTWSKKGDYTIKAHAQDEYGLNGPESTLSIMIPRTRTINIQLLNYIQNHPNLFPILQKLLNRIEQ